MSDFSGLGTCVAVGNYSVSATQFEAMGAVEVRGTWHRATEIALPRGLLDPVTQRGVEGLRDLPLRLARYPSQLDCLPTKLLWIRRSGSR